MPGVDPAAELYREWRRSDHDPKRQGRHLANRQLAGCSQCYAEIVWVRTEKGKVMALDPIPDPEGRFVVRNYEDASGRRIVHWLREEELGEWPSYTSHFATCPEAKRPTEQEKFL